MPASPGVHSAMGLLVSDLKRDYVQTHFAELEAVEGGRGAAAFRSHGSGWRSRSSSPRALPPDQIVHERAIDLRYSIQKYELPVPVARCGLKAGCEGRMAQAVRRDPREAFRLARRGSEGRDRQLPADDQGDRAEAGGSRIAEPRGASCDGAIKARRKAYFDGWHDTPIYDRERLLSGNRLRGPAIIEQMDSTTVVHPGQTRCTIDPLRQHHHRNQRGQDT